MLFAKSRTGFTACTPPIEVNSVPSCLTRMSLHRSQQRKMNIKPLLSISRVPFCVQFLQEYTQSHGKTFIFHFRLVTLSPHYDIMARKISFLAVTQKSYYSLSLYFRLHFICTAVFSVVVKFIKIRYLKLLYLYIWLITT